MNIGVDVGSTGIKIVFLTEQNDLAWKTCVPTRPGQADVVRDLIQTGLTQSHTSPDQIQRTCVTGYGRNLIQTCNQTIDEITANAAGISRLTRGEARTLINIGGQDVKIIRLSDTGEVADFKMNDKCAAGTGRFFEMAARILDIPLERFTLEKEVDPVGINATCAVFAESEIVSLLATGTDIDRIIQGINQAVARRIAKLAGTGLIREPVFVDGGPARNLGLVRSLEDTLMCDIHVVDHPQFTVAMGAVWAW